MDKYKGNKSKNVGADLQPMLHRNEEQAQRNASYDTAKICNDVAKLLTMICGYCCQFSLPSNKYMAIVAAIKNLFYFFQRDEQSNADYHEDFMAMLEVIKECRGVGLMTHFPNMLKQELEADGIDLSKATSEQLKDRKKTDHESFLLPSY